LLDRHEEVPSFRKNVSGKEPVTTVLNWNFTCSEMMFFICLVKCRGRMFHEVLP